MHLNAHHLDDNKNRGEDGSIVYATLRVRRRSLHNLIAIFSALATISILVFSDTFLATPTSTNTLRQLKPTKYEVVPGFFAQSLNSTDDVTFDFVWTHFYTC
jgi:hypothetical protein